MYSIYPSSFLPSSPASLLLAAVALHAPHRALRLRLYSRPPAFRSTSATTVWFCFVAFFNGVSPTSLCCVGAMRGLRGDLVDEIAHLDRLAQKCISFPVHKRSTKE